MRCSRAAVLVIFVPILLWLLWNTMRDRCDSGVLGRRENRGVNGVMCGVNSTTPPSAAPRASTLRPPPLRRAGSRQHLRATPCRIWHPRVVRKPGIIRSGGEIGQVRCQEALVHEQPVDGADRREGTEYRGGSAAFSVPRPRVARRGAWLLRGADSTRSCRVSWGWWAVGVRFIQEYCRGIGPNTIFLGVRASKICRRQCQSVSNTVWTMDDQNMSIR